MLLNSAESLCFKMCLFASKTILATKFSPSFLGSDEGPIKSMISDLIREANDTFNGRLHLQHVENEKNPPKGKSHKNIPCH